MESHELQFENPTLSVLRGSAGDKGINSIKPKWAYFLHGVYSRFHLQSDTTRQLTPLLWAVHVYRSSYTCGTFLICTSEHNIDSNVSRKLSPYCKGRAYTEAVWEQGAEENVWASEGGSYSSENVTFHTLFASPHLVRLIKSRLVRWVGHVARMGIRELNATFWPENLNGGYHLRGLDAGGEWCQDRLIRGGGCPWWVLVNKVEALQWVS
jgi:hypothetical protein